MLGVFPGMKYDNHECKMERGDRIFIYTDGVTEATNANNELFGEERLISAITGVQDRTSKEILELLERVNHEYNTTIVIVTHNEAISHMSDRIIHLKDGKITKDVLNANKVPAKDLAW